MIQASAIRRHGGRQYQHYTHAQIKGPLRANYGQSVLSKRKKLGYNLGKMALP